MIGANQLCDRLRLVGKRLRAKRRFQRYRVREHPKSAPEIVRDTTELVQSGYPHTGCAESSDDLVLERLEDYEAFLRKLVRLTGGRVVPLRELLVRENGCRGGTAKRFAIRHDVDIDIGTALEMARIEHAMGVASSFYILHSAPYYGYLDGGEFRRFRGMAEVLREIEGLGHEVGLHLDPYYFYDHGIDGAAAVRSEIRFMRKNGIRVVGTANHNGPESNGWFGWEIFEDVDVPDLSAQPDGARDEDKVARFPNRMLSRADLGLEYEADEEKNCVSVNYCLFNRGGADRWCYGTTIFRRFKAGLERKEEDGKLFEMAEKWKQRQERARGSSHRVVDSDVMFDALAEWDTGLRCVFHIHPVYYGLRSKG